MKITILTLFPEMFTSVFSASIIKRAVDKKLVDLTFINIRDFGLGKHKIVDDTPYGGGAGMVLRPDVLHKAIEASKDKTISSNLQKVILMSATGKTFNQTFALNFSKLKHLIIVCGHYEGVDERAKKYIDLEISVGDFILTGGEIAAMLIIDSVSRLVKGVITKESLINESFSPYLEHPHYTKPDTYKGAKVPQVLLSGDHKKILEWRKEESIKLTKKQRPDLIKKG